MITNVSGVPYFVDVIIMIKNDITMLCMLEIDLDRHNDVVLKSRYRQQTYLGMTRQAISDWLFQLDNNKDSQSLALTPNSFVFVCPALKELQY